MFRQINKEITIHNLLTHSAGLVDSLGEDEELIGREEYLKKAFDSKLIHQPGRYDYSNVGYSILAAVVENVSGEEYEHFLYEQMLKPAGMEHTGYVLPKWDHKQMAIGYSNNEEWGTTFDQSQYMKGVTWHLKGNGGIHSTVGDLYLWSQALKGNSILSEEAKKKYFDLRCQWEMKNISMVMGGLLLKLNAKKSSSDTMAEMAISWIRSP